MLKDKSGNTRTSNEVLFEIRRIAFQLARADLNVSIIEWENMPLIDLFEWYNDVKLLADEEKQANG